MGTKSINLSFGERLAQIRKSKGITQKELGERIGVSQRIIDALIIKQQVNNDSPGATK